MTCFIQNHGAAERSVDSCERNALNGIDEHFVPSKNSLGVGTSFSIHFDAKDVVRHKLVTKIIEAYDKHDFRSRS